MTEVASTEFNFNETARCSKSRITSFSSLLGEERNRSRDKLRLKKLAKVCSRPFKNEDFKSVRSTDEIQPQATVASDAPVAGDSSKLSSFSLLQITKRLKNIDMLEDQSNWRSYFDYKFNNQEEPTKGKHPAEHQVYENNANSRMKKQVNVLGQNVNIMNSGTRKQASTIYNSVSSLGTPTTDEGRRVIRLKNFPSFIGLKSVISQICGGPLEKLVLLNNELLDDHEKYILKNCVLELWFLKPEDAKEFLNYSFSGLFLINGFHITPSWAPITSQDHYHEQIDEDIEHEMTVNGARRCLILKKYIGRKVKSKRHYPSPKSHYSDLNLNDIKADFIEFGKILEISPVISKKLCIAIHYYQTSSAIEAKREYAKLESPFHQKYKEWTLWYGKDPTDRPCVNL